MAGRAEEDAIRSAVRALACVGAAGTIAELRAKDPVEGALVRFDEHVIGARGERAAQAIRDLQRVADPQAARSELVRRVLFHAGAGEADRALGGPAVGFAGRG